MALNERRSNRSRGRLLYVAEKFEKAWLHTNMWAIIKSLERSGVRVTLLTTLSGDKVDFETGVDILGSSSRLSMIARLLINSWRYDAILSYLPRSYGMLLPFIKILARVRYILKTDGFVFPPARNLRELVRNGRLGLPIWWQLRFADLVLVESPRIREAALRVVGRQKAVFFPSSVFEQRLSQLLGTYSRVPIVTKRQSNVLFVGRIHPVKGLYLLLSAFKSLANEFPSWNLVLVGAVKDTEYFASILRSINEPELNGRVQIVGPTYDDSSLYRFFYDAEIFCLPSYAEGSPNVIPAAMFFSNAIVASKVGEVPYQLDEGRCGFLFDRGSVEQLEGCLRRLMSDVDLRRTLGSRARERVLQLFTWERNMPPFIQEVLAML
jgi:glycosyltransferase involved in cell wall biosynthesis